MIGRLAALLYGIFSYLVFSATLAYAVGFVGDYLVPKSIDSGAEGPLGASILIDVVLVALFAVPHSVMARPGFKRWWTRIVPASCERSTYVLISSLLLMLLLWQWRPVGATIWRVEGWPAILLMSVSALGWLTTVTATYLIDHFDLFGLRQVIDPLRGATLRSPGFVTPLLYRFVRHPLLLGFLLAFWATPHMTVGHLVFTLSMTAYILVGVQFEEQDLLAQFGASYEQYRRRVPMLIPRLIGGRPR